MPMLRFPFRTSLLTAAALALAALPLLAAPAAAAAVASGPELELGGRPADPGGPVPVVNRDMVVVAAPDTASIAYDDGEVDQAYGPPASDPFFDLAMLFELPRPGMTVEQVSTCFTRSGADDELEFDITFWELDGTTGQPGALIDFVPAIATGVPGAGGFFNYDLSNLGIELPDADVFVGVGWDGAVEHGFFACADHDAPAVHPGFFDNDQQGIWSDLLSADPDYTALMIRGVFSDDFTPTTCVENDTTICLEGGRFQVTSQWRTRFGTSGPGHGERLTDDSGYFWFFDLNNIEFVIKVLNACVPPFDRFWVFAGGLTDVEVDIQVTDTESGQTVPYHNDLGTPFQPIQDTGAFATCP